MINNVLTIVTENIALSSLLIALVIIYIVFEIVQLKKHAFGVSPHHAIRLINREKALFLDVRDEESYQKGHIVGAISTSIDALKTSTDFLQKYKKRPLIVYCERGNRSKIAVDLLKKAGFEVVHNLTGGISQWKADKLPLHTKISSSQKQKENTKGKKIQDNKTDHNDKQVTKIIETNQNEHTMVEIYTRLGCPYCVRALALLNKKNINYKEIKIDGNEALRQEMIERSSRHTVPQVFINGESIGGCDDLYALESEAKLDPLLAKVAK